MPSFCRHNRILQNCPICTREQSLTLRPVVTSSAPKSSQPRAPSPPRAPHPSPRTTRSAQRAPGRAGLVVRRLARGADDGSRCDLVQGLKSSADAERLAAELAFAARRLAVLEGDPPGLLAEVADPAGELEERIWLAFLIAYLCPLDGEDPFAGVSAARTSWASGAVGDLDAAPLGPRSAHVAGRGTVTVDAYRAWAARAGSQAAGLSGDPSWPAERRFARAYERLALPRLRRDARYDLLVLLGHLRVYDLRAGTLELGGHDEATLAAKRLFGIGDPILLERRAAALAGAAQVPLEALDLGLHNWGTGRRAGLGIDPDSDPDPAVLAALRDALELPPAPAAQASE